MKFKANTRRRAAEYEKDLVQQWKTNKTFEKSVEMRPIDNSYVFYDGPPFITGVPHHGTLLSSVIKDAVPRYQTMKGKRVERVWGWDSHGLPAENFVEKKLGIVSRHEVGEKISLEDYIVTARDSMVSNAALWEDTVDRIGRWVDFKGAYKTMDKDYMESIWWAFSELYKKGKIYEGERVLMYDTKWATPLSKAEVTMDAGAYIEVTDPSVYVKFKLLEDNKSKRITAVKKDARVLFVCYSNAGRSHFAQGFYNHLTKTNNAESAGVSPDAPWKVALSLVELETILAELKPAGIKTTATMDEVGVDVSGHKRQQLKPEMLEKYDLIV
ncbi:MAG TPA: class I tRNA ligase family protein, partial [Candidatus Saccharibacteria bacterium]|nr:class I tRNA ligase family protein [Candidatus Saccharibacteria bacterium]